MWHSFLAYSVPSCLDTTYRDVFFILAYYFRGKAGFSTSGAVSECAYFHSPHSPTVFIVTIEMQLKLCEISPFLFISRPRLLFWHLQLQVACGLCSTSPVNQALIPHPTLPLSHCWSTYHSLVWSPLLLTPNLPPQTLWVNLLVCEWGHGGWKLYGEPIERHIV